MTAQALRPLPTYFAKHWSSALTIFVIVVLAGITLGDQLLLWCTQEFKLDFDSQNFTVWNYFAGKGYVPYRDFFYWYGLLTYYASSSPYAHLFSVGWLGVLLFGWLYLHQRLHRSWPISVAAWLGLLSVIQALTGQPAFLRYGSTIVLLPLMAIFSLRRPKLGSFVAGALSSLLLALFFDQGIYAFLIFIGYYIFLITLREKRSITRPAYFTLGALAGFVPFAVWLFNTDAIEAFIQSVQDLGGISIFAKVPFAHLLNSRGNLLMSIGLWALAADCIYLWWFKKRPVTEQDVTKLVWLGIVLILQYKNITRGSIEQMYSFVLIGISLLYWPKPSALLSRKTAAQHIGNAVIFLVLLLAGLQLIRPEESVGYYVERWSEAVLHPKTITLLSPKLVGQLSQCQTTLEQSLPNSMPTDYQKVMEWINAQGKPNIFVFPSDPIFYILFNQPPAPFFNGYDATPFKAQRANINYIVKHDVLYVILSMSTAPQQDGVPNEIRGPIMYSYLFNHFCPIHRIGEFLVLQKAEAACGAEEYFGADSLLAEEYKTHLLTTQLGHLAQITQPTSLTAQNWQTSTANQPIPLAQTLSSANQLLLIFEHQPPETTTVIFNFSEGGNSQVQFASCRVEGVCTIDLSLMPAFYFPREVSDFSVITAGEESLRWQFALGTAH